MVDEKVIENSVAHPPQCVWQIYIYMYGKFLLICMGNFLFIFQEAFRTRFYVFGFNNLHVATAHEDLGYALYVHEYSTGNFDEAR